jgi:hypothetical protein
VVWSIVEVAAALIGCCLPVLQPFFSESSKAMGSIIRSLRAVKSLVSRQSQSSQREQEEEGLAFASIGGTKFVRPEKSGGKHAGYAVAFPLKHINKDGTLV